MNIGQWQLQGRGPGGGGGGGLSPPLSQGLDPALLVLLIVKGL